MLRRGQETVIRVLALAGYTALDTPDPRVD
jgi:hypothetical protein